MQRVDDRNVRLSKALCYLLRHHERVKRNKGSHWMPYLPGGWYKASDVLNSHTMQHCTMEELTDLVEGSVSTRFQEHRFEMAEMEGELHVRARYGWSFDAENPFDPNEVVVAEEGKEQQAETGQLAMLSSLCLDQIVRDIKQYDGLAAAADSYVVEQIFDRLKQQKKLNNTVLKIFCGHATEALDFSGLAVTDSTLTKVANSCPNLVDLNLSGCLIVTDHMLKMVARKCQSLRILNISNCPNVTREGLRQLAASLPSLRVLIATNTAPVDDEFREDLAALFPHLTRLMI